MDPKPSPFLCDVCQNRAAHRKTEKGAMICFTCDDALSSGDNALVSMITEFIQAAEVRRLSRRP